MNFVHNDYYWSDALPTCAHDYVLPAVRKIIQTIYPNGPIKILDIGCGNGYVAGSLDELGHSVIGLDASSDGINIARSVHPRVQFKVCSVYDDGLIDVLGQPVDCVISLEVVEHLFYPKKLFEQSYRLLKSGGCLIVSTPYHGYFKNLALSLINGWDRHFSVDWDGGHIKFFSRRTLAKMACNAGFTNLHFNGVGRFPGLWKSIIMIAQK
jgi:2-polyprenyl-3-methyl-5-hydroxy-6-metoxy-1,4-benzoquinol methylase